MREFWRIVVGSEGGGWVCSYFLGVGDKKFDGGSKAKPGLILVVFRK